MTEELSIPTCSKGHPWSEENTLYESAGRRDGRKRRRCRQCRRDKRAEAAANAAKGIPSGASSQARRGRGEPEQPPSVLRKFADFGEAQKYIMPHCRGRYSEFTDWELEDAPTPEQAQDLCAPCVLKELCLERAEASPPAWGVWGGYVWIDGQKMEGQT